MTLLGNDLLTKKGNVKEGKKNFLRLGEESQSGKGEKLLGKETDLICKEERKRNERVI